MNIFGVIYTMGVCICVCVYVCVCMCVFWIGMMYVISSGANLQHLWHVHVTYSAVPCILRTSAENTWLSTRLCIISYCVTILNITNLCNRILCVQRFHSHLQQLGYAHGAYSAVSLRSWRRRDAICDRYQRINAIHRIRGKLSRDFLIKIKYTGLFYSVRCTH